MAEGVGDAGPGEPDHIAVRIGDRERNSALEALGEHVAAGRLTLDEYGERSAKVTAARTDDDLAALFSDLPAPHPLTTAPVPPRPAPLPVVTDSRVVSPAGDGGAKAQRLMAALVPISALLSAVLFFAFHVPWFIWLLPAAVGVIGGAIWGGNWQDDRRGELGRGRD